MHQATPSDGLSPVDMLRASGVLLSLAAFLVACAGPQPSVPSHPQSETRKPTPTRRVTVALPADVPSLYTKLSAGGLAGQGPAVEALVLSGLTTKDNDDQLQPQLAEAVPTLESGLWRVFSDGRMETTWHIRAGAQWHDGAPFTAEDLVFTAMVVRDRDLPVFGNAAFDPIDAAMAIDARTIMVTWRSPYIKADTMFGAIAAPMPRHLLERAYLDDKPGFTQLAYWSQEFVGTGPYKLRELARGSHVLLDAFAGYVLGRPRIDELEARIIPDDNALIANILAGAVDLTLGNSLSIEQALQFRDRWTEGRIGTKPGRVFSIFPQFIDPNPAVIADVRFRRALLHALDRQELVDTITGGLSSVAHCWVHPTASEYREVEPYIVRYEYDPRRATELIEGLGYRQGADGSFRDRASQRVSVEISSIEAADNQKAMLAAAAAWQRIGIAAEPVPIPPQRSQNREYRATFPGFTVNAVPGTLDDMPSLHSSQTPVPENNFSGRNTPRYRSTELDALIDRYLATIPIRERNQALGQVIRHMTEQVVSMGVLHRVDPTAIASRLQNVRPGNPTWNLHEWELRQ